MRGAWAMAAAVVAMAGVNAVGEGGLAISDHGLVAGKPVAHSVELATYIGGGGADTAEGVACDAAGNLYVCGSTNSKDFPSVMEERPPAQGKRDAYVLKLDGEGRKGLMCLRLGGGGESVATSLAVDAAGGVYVTGTTDSADFPATLKFPKDLGGKGPHVFVARLSAEGKLQQAVMLGGNYTARPVRLVLDRAGQVAIAGYTNCGAWPVTTNALEAKPNGLGKSFVVVLSKDLTKLVYSTTLSSWGAWAPDCNITDMAAARDGTLVIGGAAMDKLPVTPGALAEGKDRTTGFVARINPAGAGKGTLGWLTYVPAGGTRVGALALDRAGNVVAGGEAFMQKAEDFPVKAGAAESGGAIQPGRKSKNGAFVMKISGRGNALMSAALFGGTSTDKVVRMIAAADGAVYAIGETYSADFPTLGAVQGAYGGTDPRGKPGGDLFVLRTGPDGKVQFCTLLGGPGSETCGDALLTGKGELVVVGSVSAKGFPVSAEAPLEAFRGESKGFLVRLKAGEGGGR